MIKRTRVTHGLLVMLAGLAAVATGCSGKLPGPAAASSCGDQCASMSCPAGSHCVLSSQCSPSCELETLTPAR